MRFNEGGAMGRRCALRALAGAAVACPFVASAAEPALPGPRGEVLLTVTGRIAVTNADGSARLDRELMLAMGTSELTTRTPFTDGVSTFMGVLVARLLDRLGATGTELRTTALNDYAVVIPVTEVRAYPVLLALSRDGNVLSTRERGPLWVIYPWSDYPELDDRAHRQRSIWQLSAIEVA